MTGKSELDHLLLQPEAVGVETLARHLIEHHPDYSLEAARAILGAAQQDLRRGESPPLPASH